MDSVHRGWLISAALGAGYANSWFWIQLADWLGPAHPRWLHSYVWGVSWGSWDGWGRLGLSFHWCLTPGRPSSLRRLAQLIPKMSVFQRVTVEATGALKLGSHTGHLSLLLMAKVDHRANSDSSNWKIDSISCKKNWWSYLIYHRKAWWKTLGWGQSIN